MEAASTTFVLASVMMALFSTIFAVFLLVTRRHLIIKPTFFIGLLTLGNSWSAAANTDLIYSFLPFPWHFLLVAQVTPAIFLIISTFSFNRPCKEVWNIATSVPVYQYRALKRVVLIVLALTAACIGIYFLYVPPSKTGLWVALAYGEDVLSRDAREESLKLLPAIPRYVFSLNREVFARYLAAMLALLAVAGWKLRRQRLFLLIPIMLVCLAASASLYGARGPGGMVIAAFFLAWYLYKKAPVKVSYVLAGLGLVLLIPTVISVARASYGELTVGGIWNEFTDKILHRVFMTRTETGIRHMDYVQRNGYWGISDIAKLAPLFNIQPVNVDNLIMNVYVRYSPTGLATVDSFVTNYARFGLLGGMTFSIMSVWVFDLLLLIFRRITPAMLIPAITILLICVRRVNSSNYETLFITGGLLPALLLLWFLNSVVRKKEHDLENSFGGLAHLPQHATD